MRRLSGILALLLALAVAGPAWASQEAILSFDSQVLVGGDGALTVTETIVVNALGDAIKHGIYRDFPVTYRKADGSNYNVGFHVVAVSRDGRPEPWFQKTMGYKKRVYMGSKDRLLQPGEHRYRLTYRTTRQIGFFKDHDELYWNVTGNDWPFPIRHASATVRLPDSAKITRIDAFTGTLGARGRNWKAGPAGQNEASFETTRPLPAGEGFTIAVAWPKGIVLAPGFVQELGRWMWDNLHWLIALGISGLLLLYFLVAWNRVGRDPPVGTIVPLFHPPEKVSPAHVRYIMRMGYDDKTLTASVVNLAVQGFLTIDRTDDGYYRLSRCAERKNDQPAGRGEREFLDAIFSEVGRIVLKRSSSRWPWIARRAHETSVTDDCEGTYFERNARLYSIGFVASLFAGTTWIYGVIYEETWRAAGIAASGIGMLYLLNLLFRRLLPAPTTLGHKVKREIEGFRMYLATAEQERLDALNPPERTPALFEKYLPYAIALDVENEWGDQFRDVLAAAAAATATGIAAASLYQPAWYDGGWDSGGLSNESFGSGFSAALGDSLSHAAVPPPGTNSGFGGGAGANPFGDGFGGGFSGGGGSGGGGGGGGGGGW